VNVISGYPSGMVFRDSNLAMSGLSPSSRTTKSKCSRRPTVDHLTSSRPFHA
jgi:hypothetical protein